MEGLTGLQRKEKSRNRIEDTYGFTIVFFKKGLKYKISNHEKDETISSIKSLEKRILRIYQVAGRDD